MGGIEIHALGKQFQINNRLIPAVCNFELQVSEREFVTIVGKSGCGKTTLLRLICGLENADQGYVRLAGHNGKAFDQRVSIVFQEPRLMPWLTVRQNMAFSLLKENDHQKVDRTVNFFLNMLGLTPFQDAYPRQISGGMAQRTALGRTLCFDPDIILMDEPFGALDAFTRHNLQQELVDIFLSQNKTIIFVTHDVNEAVLLGQRVLVMDKGSIRRELAIDIPYPRDALSKDFYNLREEILRSVLKP